MILENQKEIEKLDNCPMKDDLKTIRLYRFCANNPILIDDLIPKAISNPDAFSENCLAWGLSLFNTKEATIKMITGFSVKTRKKIKGIAVIEVDSNIAVKHQSGDSKNHYTVYPYQNVNFISRFTTENI
jgi:hypothetical protein